MNQDACQFVTYNYDTNPDITVYPYNQFTAGRLTSVHYGGKNCQTVGVDGLTGNNYVEMYSYAQNGQLTNKRFRLTRQNSGGTAVSGDLESAYTYNMEGMLTSQTYPLGTRYWYTYDAMGRPTKMSDLTSGQDLVSAVTYGPAGELLSMTGTSVGETRTYNSMGQLVTLTGLNGVNLQYNYAAAGANNGQIASQQDLSSGETVSYQYDSLQRLAQATSTQGWGQGFTYDGFGNLTAKSVLSGSPPQGSYPVDPATNRLSGVSYDANGSQLSANGSALVYDVSNRISSSTGPSLQGFYEYDASNRRVYQLKQHFTGSAWGNDAQEFYFYGFAGRKLGTYFATVTGSGTGASISWNLLSTQVFFHGRLIQRSAASAQQDRLGSIGSYFPYGEDRSAPSNDAIKFATYVRDSTTGLDYAENRYYASGVGRFLTPDPWGGSALSSIPLSWNRYPYVAGDPVNQTDRRGLNADACEAEDEDCCDDYDPFCDMGPGRGPGGGGGASSFVSNKGPDGTGPWTTDSERAANIAILIAIQNAILKKLTTSQPRVHLVLTNDCILTKDPRTGKPSRNRTYEALDQNNDEINALITERVLTGSGGLYTGVLNPTSSNSGTFSDGVGLGMFQTGDFTLYQYFVTTVPGTPWTNYPTPVSTSSGSFLAFAIHIVGTATLTSSFYDVSYNGDGGMWNKDGTPRLPLCNQ